MNASHGFRFRVLAFGLLGFVALVGGPAEAALIHDFEFKGTLNDSLGGPALVSLGGTLGASSYTFGAEQGLSLTSGLTTSQSSTYTIDLNFEFDSTSGYRKIVDFKNLASDNGLYNLSTNLNYYNFTTGPDSVFVAGTFLRVDLTRDNATGLVVGYVNGVQQLSFSDTSADAVFNAANNVANFFQDDNVTGGRESSSGSVNQIRIYDTALTASAIAGLGTVSVPEPSTMIMTAAGLALVGLSVHRSRRGV